MTRKRRLRPNKGQVVLSALVLGVAWAAYTSLTAAKLAPDGCALSGAIGHHVVLLDGSDPIVDSQLRALQQQLGKLVASLQPNRKLWIFLFGGEEEADLIAVSAGCNPVAERSLLRGAVWEARAQAAFFEPVAEAIRALEASEKGHSPIVEGTDRLLFMPELFEGEGAELLVYSDFIQNTPAWSHFPTEASYQPPGARKWPSRVGLPPDRKWSAITLREVQRPHLRVLQGARSARWWEQLMARVSKAPVRFEKL